MDGLAATAGLEANVVNDPAIAGTPAAWVPIVLRVGGQTWRATPDRLWTIGRAAEADVRLDDPGISRRHGQLSRLAAWGPWVSIGAIVLSGLCGVLTLLAARRRGKALTSLGVSALLVGAGGWGAIGGRPVYQ